MSQLQVGKVLGSKYDDDGFLCVQVETFGSSDITQGWFRLYNPHGFQTRPLDPDNVTACQAMYWVDGTVGYAILLNDPRQQNALLQSQKGESFFHGPGGSFIRMHADGTISLFTTDDGTTEGRGVQLQVSGKGLLFNFPYGRLTFDDTGFHVLHNSGARIDLGAIGGLPAPLSALQSYVTISAAIAKVEGAAVGMGTREGSAQPVALATAVLALCTSLNNVLAAIGTGGLLAPAGSAGGPCIPGPDLGPLIAAATTALATATAAVPSLSTATT